MSFFSCIVFINSNKTSTFEAEVYHMANLAYVPSNMCNRTKVKLHSVYQEYTCHELSTEELLTVGELL